MTKTIQDVIKTYYPHCKESSDTFKCVVCTTKPKTVNKEGKDLVKNGIHITFPLLNIELEQAYQLRYNVVYELEKKMGKRGIDCNPWVDAIDKAPYRGGMKMCGSFKMVKCISCKTSNANQRVEEKEIKEAIRKLRKKLKPNGAKYDHTDIDTIQDEESKDSEFQELYSRYLEISALRLCTICNNRGRYIEDRTYMPDFVLDSDGNRDESLIDQMSQDMYIVMKNTSIRCITSEEVTPGYKKPKGVPVAPTDTNSVNMRIMNREKFAHMGNSIMQEAICSDMFQDDASGIVTWKGPQVFESDKIMAIEEFIHSNFSGQYMEIQVKDVFEHHIGKKQPRIKSSAGRKTILSIAASNNCTQDVEYTTTIEKSYLVRVTGKGSMHCLNKGGEHTSNSVYFRFTPQFCYQKCFSRKDEIRSGGNKPCGEFRSPGVPLSTIVVRKLFPDHLVEVAPTSALSFCKSNTSQKNKCPSPDEYMANVKRSKRRACFDSRLIT